MFVFLNFQFHLNFNCGFLNFREGRGNAIEVCTYVYVRVRVLCMCVSVLYVPHPFRIRTYPYRDHTVNVCISVSAYVCIYV